MRQCGARSGKGPIGERGSRIRPGIRATPPSGRVSRATAHAAPRPPNYREIIQANMGRSDMALPILRQLEVGLNRCSVSASPGVSG
jgi:hypothetical protein